MFDCTPVLEGEENLTSSFDVVVSLSNHSFEPRYNDHASAPYNLSGSHHGGHDEDDGQREIYEQLEFFIYSKVMVPICVFGLLGNILNLVVLTRKGLQKHMDRMERSAHTGLIALALSDMLFCIVLLPYAWVDLNQFDYDSAHFDLYYQVYSEGLISMFIMASTWLTVAMATSRYLAVCHPLRAREVIGMTFARCSIAVVFVFCVLFNLPRFWRRQIDYLDCHEGGRVYFINRGFLQKEQVLGTVYLWVYFIIGIVGPLLVLLYCNAHLVRALNRSTALRRSLYEQAGGRQPRSAAVEGTHRITLTLIVIVVMYVCLVSPAEIINFLQKAVIDDASRTHAHNLAVAVVNALQAANFSLNFVLYCVINVHFRQTVRDFFCCACSRRRNRHHGSEGFRSSRTCYDSVTMTTTTGIVMKNMNATDL